jgi:hypothetical protein
MSATITPTARVPYRLLAAMAMAHAFVALLIWLAVFTADTQLIPARVWAAFVWLWLVWPVLLALHPGRTLKRLAIPLLVSLALLAPCIPVALMFTAWAIGGFAP